MKKISIDYYLKNLNELLLFHSEVNEGVNETQIVIVGTAYLDNILYEMLSGFLISNSKTVKKMLDHRGILGTFSAKVDMLYALGFLRKIIKSDLEVVCRIRNEFAHNMSISFQDENIINLVKSFNWHEEMTMMPAPKEATPFDIFKVELNTLVSHLGGIATLPFQEKRKEFGR